VELTGLIPIIRRWAMVIIVATAVAVLIGLFLGSSAEKTYEARAQLLVGPLSTDSNTMRASGDLAQTYAELATSSNVLGTVARDVDVPRSQLDTGVRAAANSTTRFLSIRARSRDAETAAEIANSVSLQLINLGAQDPTRPEGKLRIIDPAGAPSSPVSPRLDLIVPLAAVAGLLGSITLILLFEFVGDTAESIGRVQTATGGPAIAVKRRRGRHGAREGSRADELRVVATQVELAAEQVRCVVLTGTARGDGSAGLALDLGEVWGERRRRVAVVDAGSGEITRITGGEAHEGLAEWLTAGADHHALPAAPWSGVVEVVPTGMHTGAEAVRLEEARRAVEQLAGDDGLVVVHCLPATVSAATLTWAQAADVTVLVVRRFQSRRTAIEEAVANLRIVGARLPFTILLDASRSGLRRQAGSPPRSRRGKPPRDGFPTAVDTTAAGSSGPAILNGTPATVPVPPVAKPSKAKGSRRPAGAGR
jgi:capsular polysaccharide biosynthesis protein